MVLQDDLNRLQKQLGNFLPRKCPFCGPSPAAACCAAAAKATPALYRENAPCQGTFGRCARRCTIPPRPGGYPPLQVSGHTGGLDCFGRLLADCAARWYSGEFDTVTWVPVSRKRLRQRALTSPVCWRPACAWIGTWPRWRPSARRWTTPPSRGSLTPSIAGPTCWESTRPCRERPGQASPAHRRYRHHRLHPHRVRPGAAGGRGR